MRLRDQVIQPVHLARRRCERSSGRPARCAALTIRALLSRLPRCLLEERGYIAISTLSAHRAFDEAPDRMPAAGGAGADENIERVYMQRGFVACNLCEKNM